MSLDELDKHIQELSGLLSKHPKLKKEWDGIVEDIENHLVEEATRKEHICPKLSQTNTQRAPYTSFEIDNELHFDKICWRLWINNDVSMSVAIEFCPFCGDKLV